MYRKLALSVALCTSAFALEQKDRSIIEKVIQDYTDSWNFHQCKGFADNYSQDADFVNIFGMKFTGKEEIETRHIQILQGFLKDSTFEVLNTHLRDVQPGLVIATIQWRVKGFRGPGMDISKPGVTREGIFTHVFVRNNDKWEITAAQNTLKL